MIVFGSTELTKSSLIVRRSGISRKKLAAVLVLLYETGGELRVLLTTRSKHLRAHPGQTALPGGKADETDDDLVYTAVRFPHCLPSCHSLLVCQSYPPLFGQQFREAYEEVGLACSSPDIHTLCTLSPFLSQAQLIVTPVVAFLTNPAVLGTLKPSVSEVDRIFTHPLEAVLDPSLSKKESLVPRGSEDWSYPEELHVRACFAFLPGCGG